MNLVICGSIDVSDRLIQLADELEGMGYTVELPHYTIKIRRGEVTLADYVKAKEQSGDQQFRAASQHDLIKLHWELVRAADVVLVANYEKKGIPGYIGGNTFLEMGFAHVLGKPLYVLNPLPDLPYKDEMLAMQPSVLDGDLDQLKRVAELFEATA